MLRVIVYSAMVTIFLSTVTGCEFRFNEPEKAAGKSANSVAASNVKSESVSKGGH